MVSSNGPCYANAYQCGTINSFKIIKEADGLSATATIEFESIEDSLAAKTKDQKKFQDHTIDVEISGGATLFVTNFAKTADENTIRDMFSKVSEVLPIKTKKVA